MQVFLNDPPGVTLTARFWMRLGGFSKVRLAGGESKEVQVPIVASDLAMVDDDAIFRVMPGNYTVQSGPCGDSAFLFAEGGLVVP